MITNFHPISILPVASKIMERVVRDQIMEHLQEFSLLSDRQSGFRRGYSTQDVLLYVTEKWRRALDSGNLVGAVFLDLSKAFDCVNHNILLSKLAHYGIRSSSLDWVHSYLHGRTQCTIVDGCSSEWATIIAGVPQGSILGPLLFSLYVNDLPNVTVNSDISLYADDTETDTSAHDLSQITNSLQKDLDAIDEWMSVNKLKLNPDKCKCMLIGSHQRVKDRSLILHLNGSVIENVNCVKYLGILIDNHLDWTTHTNGIVSKVSRRGENSTLQFRFLSHSSSFPPPLLRNIFTYSSQKSGHFTRNAHSIFIHSVKTNMGKSSLYYRGAVIWNSLDEALYDCDSVSSFKLLYKQIYSI